MAPRSRTASATLATLASLGASIAVAALAACTPAAGADSPSAPAVLELTSSAFAPGGELDPRYGPPKPMGRCTVGLDINPPLAWSPGPPETVTYAIGMVERDRNDYVHLVHWVHVDIPANITSVAEGGSETLAGQAGRGQAGFSGYRGACPAPGEHRYEFAVWALDTTLAFDEPPTYFDVELAIQGHVLASGTLTAYIHAG